MPHKGRGRRQKKAAMRIKTIRETRGPEQFREWGKKGGRPRKVQS